MKIFIVRHGETNGNLRGVLQGWTDEPLNDKGRNLARITAQALSEIKFDVVISSPLSRAYETAQIMLEENKNKRVEIQIEERIKEMFFGSWEGLGLTKENFEIPSDNFNLFYTEPFSFVNSEDGESIFDVCERTGAFYKELIHNPDYQDKTILLTTHGFALRAMLQQVYEDKEDFWHGKVPDNCAVNIIEVEEGKSRLIGDDEIYYDPSLCVNPYEPV